MSWDRDKERKAGMAYSIGGNIFALVFMIFWCCVVAATEAWFMLIFGLFGLGMTGYRLYMSIQHAKAQKKRDTEPWDRSARSWQESTDYAAPTTEGNGFCPYCGSAAQPDFEFCPKCGRRLK